MGRQPHKHKLFIAGNHEVGWQHFSYRRNEYLHRAQELGLVYLEDSGVEIEGIKFWGSPWQPQFMNWAFNLARGAPLKRKWAQIPDDTQVLITHGPPYGFGDTNGYDPRFGCQDLFERVMVVKPEYHLFGHAHDGYGTYMFEGVTFINCAVLNEGYALANPPVVIDVDPRRR
jgi:Icc-related predicted phosphoesterase